MHFMLEFKRAALTKIQRNKPSNASLKPSVHRLNKNLRTVFSFAPLILEVYSSLH